MGYFWNVLKKHLLTFSQPTDCIITTNFLWKTLYIITLMHSRKYIFLEKWLSEGKTISFLNVTKFLTKVSLKHVNTLYNFEFFSGTKKSSYRYRLQIISKIFLSVLFEIHKEMKKNIILFNYFLDFIPLHINCSLS